AVTAPGWTSRGLVSCHSDGARGKRLSRPVSISARGIVRLCRTTTLPPARRVHSLATSTLQEHIDPAVLLAVTGIQDLHPTRSPRERRLGLSASFATMPAQSRLPDVREMCSERAQGRRGYCSRQYVPQPPETQRAPAVECRRGRDAVIQSDRYYFFALNCVASFLITSPESKTASKQVLFVSFTSWAVTGSGSAGTSVSGRLVPLPFTNALDLPAAPILSRAFWAPSGMPDGSLNLKPVVPSACQL